MLAAIARPRECEKATEPGMAKYVELVDVEAIVKWHLLSTPI